MSEKVLTLHDMRKLCGEAKKSTFDVIEYLSHQEEPSTEKEIIDKIGYGPDSHYINKLLNDLSDLGVIEKIKAPKKSYKYKLSSKKFVICF
ncbi:MAG TPA: winged helix DNA-binding protein [Candidatus Methanoperedens sp.]